MIGCPVSAEAFRVASLFRESPDTYRLRGNPPYPTCDAADFVTRSIGNRARSANTLKRVADFAYQFYRFATERDPPFPTLGGESLLATTLWLQSLLTRGATIPHFGRYSLRVSGEAIGVRFPLERPAVRSAANTAGCERSKPRRRRKPSSL